MKKLLALILFLSSGLAYADLIGGTAIPGVAGAVSVSSTDTFTAPKTFTAPVTFVASATATNSTFTAGVLTATGAVTLGGNGNAVILSSNAVVPGTTFYQNGNWIINGSAGTSGQLLQSGGSGASPSWVSGPALASTSTWTAPQIFNAAHTITWPTTVQSSVTIVGAVGATAPSYSLVIGTQTAGNTNQTYHVAVSTTGHLTVSGGKPLLSSCPTNAVVNGDDIAGVISWGGNGTSCIATFATPYTNVPVCVCSSTSTTSGCQAGTSKTSLTATLSASSGAGIAYHCFGNQD